MHEQVVKKVQCASVNRIEYRLTFGSLGNQSNKCCNKETQIVKTHVWKRYGEENERSNETKNCCTTTLIVLNLTLFPFWRHDWSYYTFPHSFCLATDKPVVWPFCCSISVLPLWNKWLRHYISKHIYLEMHLAQCTLLIWQVHVILSRLVIPKFVSFMNHWIYLHHTSL